jgi:Family of unknown function (DUF6279)
MRFAKLILIILLACLINSCGFIKTVYNNAPELTSWWLDSYFDFTKAQTQVLNPGLHRLHDWHRENQLSGYVNLLQKIQTDLSKQQIKPDEACKIIEVIKTSLLTLQLESVPLVVELAPMLSEQQLQFFQKKLTKRTDYWKSEWLQDSAEEQLEIRLGKTVDFAEKVYGDLNDVQLALLKKNLKLAAINPAITYAEILRRNQDTVEILTQLQSNALSLPEKTALVKAGFERLQHSPNSSYQYYANNITAQTCEIISKLHETTSATQKQHAQQWVQEYIDYFSALKKQ